MAAVMAPTECGWYGELTSNSPPAPPAAVAHRIGGGAGSVSRHAATASAAYPDEASALAMATFDTPRRVKNRRLAGRSMRYPAPASCMR